MRIAMLTGGGDVPGLNPAIKTVVNRAVDAGHEVIGIRRGWYGLLYYDPDNPASHDAAKWAIRLSRCSPNGCRPPASVPHTRHRLYHRGR